MEIQEILEKVKNGAMSVEEAEGFLRREPFEEMGYAKLDMHRKVRSGFAEVIYCAGKADEHLLHIFEHLYKADGQVFGTRATQHQYEILREKYPQVEYDPISHIIKIEKKDKEHIGNIAVCTAGTADIAVAEEAAQTAEYFGTKVTRVYDVGVSGIHRLLRNLEAIQSGRDGRCTGKRTWRAGGQAGDRCADFRRLWCKSWRTFCTSDDDKFLCKRNCGGKY